MGDREVKLDRLYAELDAARVLGQDVSRLRGEIAELEAAAVRDLRVRLEQGRGESGRSLITRLRRLLDGLS